MLKRLWLWLWKGPERSWTVAECQHQVEMLRMEWSDVLDKLAAREDRERKRSKARIAPPEPELGLVEGEVTKDQLRARIRARSATA